MVTHSQDNGIVQIIARPNHSATWRSNLYALIGVAIPSLVAAIGFALLGAWPILPFAGLELSALGAALYYVNWKLQYRHVITLSADSVRIDKGFYLPRQSWQFARQQAGLRVATEAHPWDGPGLSLHDRRESVSVGEFLCRDDALALLEILRRELRVDAHSAVGRRDF